MSKVIKKFIIFSFALASITIFVRAQVKEDEDVNTENQTNEEINLNIEEKLLLNTQSSSELEGLNDLLEVALKQDLSLLTPESASQLQTAIKQANAIINSNTPVSEDLIAKAEGNLATALSNRKLDQVKELRELVTEVDLLIKQVSKYNLQVFTDQSFKGLNEPLAGAKVVLNSMSDDQAAAERVFKDLQTAKSNLEYINPDGKNTNTIIAEIRILINNVEGLKAYDYTKASFNLLLAAKEEAESLFDYNVYPIDTFRLAKASLETSLNNLVVVDKNDKEKLAGLVKETKALDLSIYTKESVLALNKALKASEDLIADEANLNLEDKDEVAAADKQYKLVLDDLQTSVDNLEKLDKDIVVDDKPEKPPVDEIPIKDELIDLDSNEVTTGIENNYKLFIIVLVSAGLVLSGLIYLKYRNKEDK